MSAEGDGRALVTVGGRRLSSVPADNGWAQAAAVGRSLCCAVYQSPFTHLPTSWRRAFR